MNFGKCVKRNEMPPALFLVDFHYNGCVMIASFLLILVAALFVAVNVVMGCYLAIRFGYGPPNWQTALNLVVRLTTFQNCLNDGRDWLDKKAPWMDQFLNRLHVPKPIIIVDTTPEEEPDGEREEESDEPTESDKSEELVEERSEMPEAPAD